MPTIDNLFGNQLVNVQNALSKATERHAKLTNNLANVNTPGFKRSDVDFNILLEEQSNTFAAHQKEMREQQEQVASDRVSLRMDGNNVDMEHEVMSVAETQLRYEALSDIAVNYFSQLKSAIRGQ